MSVIGTAEILVVPVTTGFDQQLKAQLSGSGTARAAEDAGVNAGAGLRTGVKSEADKLGEDLAGTGAKAGAGFTRGAKGGLGEFGKVIEAAGLPLGSFGAGLETADKRMGTLAGHSSQFAETIATIPTPVAAAGVALTVAAGYAAKLAISMENVEVEIEQSAGVTKREAHAIGEAFLETAGTAEYTAQELGTAYASVGGQLKVMAGHVLDASEAWTVMDAAMKLTEATQGELTGTSDALVNTMQAFGAKGKEASEVSNTLFLTSKATGLGIGELSSQLIRMHGRLGETGGSVSELSALIVDLENHGITGRLATQGLATAMGTLEKAANAAQKPLAEQKAIAKELDPAALALAKGYRGGEISVKEYDKRLKELNPTQAALVKEWGKLGEEVEKAERKFREAGVTVFNSQGTFVGFGSIIDQLRPKFERMTEAQRRQTAESLFGGRAAAAMTTIILGGAAAYDKARGAVTQKAAVDKAAQAQSEALDGEWKKLTTSLSDFGTKVGGVVLPVLTALVTGLNFVADTAGTVVKFIRTHWSELGPIFEVVLGPLAIVVGGFKNVKHEGESIFNAFVDGVKSIWETFKHTFRAPAEAAEQLPGEIWNALKGIPGEMMKLGEQLVEGLISGFEGKAKAFIHKVENLPGEVVGALGELVGKSPSPLTTKVGEHMAEGLAHGMGKKSAMATAAAAAMGKRALEELWVSAGGQKSLAQTMAAIALAESGGNPGSTNVNTNGTTDRGLWQINSSHGSQSTYDIPANARSAVAIEKEQGLGAWTTYKTGAYNQFLGAPGGAALSSQVAPKTAPSKPTQSEKLNAEIKRQEQALKVWEAEQRFALSQLKGTERATAQETMTLQKIQMQAEIAVKKETLKATDTSEKQQAAERTKLSKAADASIAKGLEAIHKGGWKALEQSLYSAHLHGLNTLDKELVTVHDKNLKALGKELSGVWANVAKEAAVAKAAAEKVQGEKEADERAKEAEQQETSEAATIRKETSAAKSVTDREVAQMADNTRLVIDEQAAVGKSGSALIAAQSQVALDKVIAANDQKVLIAEHEAEASIGMGAKAEAQSAKALQEVEDAAKRSQQEAQDALDKARAGEGSSESTAGATVPSGTWTFNFIGANPNPQELLSEVGWVLKTGGLAPASGQTGNVAASGAMS